MILKPDFKRYIASEVLAAGVTAAGSLAGAGASAAGQASLNKKTREFNREEAEKQRAWNEFMAEKQNAWNQEFWLRATEYDNPANQVQRLRDAGLNPLYYGLDGNVSQSAPEAAQPLGYERASVGNQANPFASFEDAAMRAAQVTALELENAKKKKELGWMDDEHNVDMQIKNATVDEIRTGIDKAKVDIDSGKMDVKLKEKDLDKKDAEIAVEWATFMSIGLDNEHKQILNPLLERAQQLENQILESNAKFVDEKNLAELAETRAHIAALYAQAALDGAHKEGVQLDNKVKAAEARFAGTNAQNRANLMKWTAFSQREKMIQEKYGTHNAKYYSEHYEEAFRNSWSKSGVEYGITEKLGEVLGTACLLGVGLSF